MSRLNLPIKTSQHNSIGQSALAKQNLVIAKTKEVEAKLIKANHLYSFISNINRTISKVQNEKSLFKDTCRIAVLNGDFKIAWLAMIDEENQLIKMVSSYGVSTKLTNILKNKTYNHNDPIQHLLNGENFHIYNNLFEDKEDSWLKYTYKESLNSAIYLAIKKNKKTIACLCIYSKEPDFFDKAEISMLLEAANDISFCLDNIELSKQHKFAAAVIEHSEQRFRLLTEKSPEMVTITTKKDEILYASPSITKILGYTDTEIMKTELSVIIHPNDLKLFLFKKRKLLQTKGASFTNEYRLLHKNGNWVWCEAMVTNYLSEPSINGIVTNFRDISVRKEQELKIQFNSNNLSALINNSGDLFWSVDTNYKLITCNLPYEKILKKELGVNIKKGDNVLLSFLPKKILNLYKNWYERAFKGEFFTEIFYTQEPQNKWIEISFHPIKEGKLIVGTACHARDITELKKTEQLLQKSRTFVKDVLNSLSASIAVIDAKGFIIEVNESWNQFSIKNEEPNLHKTGIGSNYLSVCKKSEKSGDEIAKQVLAGLKSVYENEKSEFYLEYPCHSPIAQNWFGMKATKLKSDDSNLVISHEDITERKITELDKSKVTQDLIQRNRDLEQFTFIVSHNLRGPLVNILGISNILNTEFLDPEELKKFINSLCVSANSLDNVLKDLNTILQVKYAINDKKEQISFSSIVNEISVSIAQLIEKDKVTIIQNFTAINEIYSLRAFVYSVFYNLITNSIKYAQPNLPAKIEITSKYKNEKTVLTFKDNGLGIDLKKNSNKVFGLYNRFHRHLEGKGMGMFMTKTQVESIGGTIKIESEPLKGTIITIEI